MKYVGACILRSVETQQEGKIIYADFLVLKENVFLLSSDLELNTGSMHLNDQRVRCET